jgi:hypothetical protein
MRRPLWLLLGLPLLGVGILGILYAGTAHVSQRTVWIVPYDHQQTLRIQPGDVIELWTEPLALIPDNLESTFRASTAGPGVELVGEALPHKEGTMERLFFFKAFEPGPATLKVELVHAEGAVRNTWTYQVEVVPPQPED